MLPATVRLALCSEHVANLMLEIEDLGIRRFADLDNLLYRILERPPGGDHGQPLIPNDGGSLNPRRPALSSPCTGNLIPHSIRTVKKQNDPTWTQQGSIFS
jgi:hypothetical protein